MKRGTQEHPKFLRLCILLNLRKYEAMGLLESIWHFTARFAPQGNIGKFTDAEIAKAVEWERPTGTKGVGPECKLSAALVESGWIDRDENHRLLVHDWPDHADQTVKRFLASRGLAFIQHSASPPLPLPEPIPEPMPKADSADAEFETELDRVAEAIHQRHPRRKCSLALVKKKLRTICSRVAKGERAVRLRSVDANHASMCTSHDWTKDDGEYVKSLDGWLNPSAGKFEFAADENRGAAQPKATPRLLLI